MANRIESINMVDAYEENGKETTITRPKITVREHWNRKEFVVMNIADKSYTFLAKDLIKAIENARNAHD